LRVPAETAIVDGTSGRIYLAPDGALLAEYRRAQQRFAIVAEHLDGLRSRPAETRDGRRVCSRRMSVCSRTCASSSATAQRASGSSAPSCWRSPTGAPPEDEQENPLRARGARDAPRPVTIRTLDLGGDKAVPNVGLEAEENPQLGAARCA